MILPTNSAPPDYIATVMHDAEAFAEGMAALSRCGFYSDSLESRRTAQRSSPQRAIQYPFVVEHRANGDKYIGQVGGMFKEPCGYGVLVGLNGDRYEGGWEGGTRHGKGTQVFGDDGRVLEAFFVRDRVPGNAVIRYSDGAVYRGGVDRSGKPRGSGAHTFASGGMTWRGRFCSKGFCGPGNILIHGDYSPPPTPVDFTHAHTAAEAQELKQWS